MDYDQHLILHHLDDPLRFLHWTLDEALAVMGPIFLGLAADYPVQGMIMAGFCYWGLLKLKREFGFDNIKHALYWYFPKSDKKLPNLPHSYMREFIG